MNKVKPNSKCVVIAALLAVVHSVVTFFTDRMIFMFPENASEHFGMAVIDYSVCKIIVFLLLTMLYYSVLAVFLDKGEYAKEFKRVVLCAAPYLVVLAGTLIIKLPQGFLTNDENAIYQNAITLTHDTWFNYLTNYYYIASLMIFPFKYGPIIAKIVLEFFTVGYVVYRVRLYYKGKAGYFSYLVFILYPVIAYTTSAHRLPVYFFLYLLLFSKLIFDALEKKELNYITYGLMLVLGAMLTQWRTEGIYLAVLVPILMLFVYPSLRNKKSVIILIVATCLVQYIISIPQNGMGAGLSDKANDRMKPFYAYTITNMYRNGLNLEKNAEDLAIVDKYLSLDKVREINEYYQDINYEDVLILYKDEFMGVRPEADVTEYIEYTKALKRIFINNPDIFMKTRWGAFKYAALPYHIVWPQGGIRGLVSFGVSLIKSVSYNLFIPVILMFVLLVYSLIKKRWYSFFFFGGLSCHWFIVFILAPASYFKYYFPVYIMAYFYVMILALWYFCGRKKELKSPLI